MWPADLLWSCTFRKCEILMNISSVSVPAEIHVMNHCHFLKRLYGLLQSNATMVSLERATKGQRRDFPQPSKPAPRAGLDGCGKSRPPPGFDPRTVQPIASRYTDCAIPTHNATMNKMNAVPRFYIWILYFRIPLLHFTKSFVSGCGYRSVVHQRSKTADVYGHARLQAY